jgi:predicted SAM-dependent methyltransferase
VIARTLVFAADTLIRFRGGRILIHTTTSALPAFETEQPLLVGWLCQFRRPTPVAGALAAVASAEREGATRILEYLLKAGALVDAEVAAPTEPDQLRARTLQHMRLLSRSLYEVGCDLQGLDPTAEHRLSARTGIGIERRLMALLAAVDGFSRELAQLRGEQLEGQLASLGVGPDSRELKLHIGCGRDHLTGWINIDVHPAPLALNILRGLPFPAGSARHVFVSHLLEHLFFPSDVRALLAELRRVLAPRGLVRIVVPDIEQCIEAYASRDQSFFASRRETWTWWPPDATRLEDFLAYSGIGPEPAHLFESHKYGYDFETLERTLRDAGFVNIVRSAYMASSHESLRVDEISAVAKAKYGERYYSLFVEAERGP